jgi:hypothetical protein
MENLSRPHPDNVMSYNEAIAIVPKYKEWINHTYIDTRDGEKSYVVDVIVAPATDPEYAQFMLYKLGPETFGNIPYQVVVIFESDNNPPPYEYLVDFETHYKIIS